MLYIVIRMRSIYVLRFISNNNISIPLYSNSIRNTITMYNNDNNLLLRYFSFNYIGPIIIIFECTDKKNNVTTGTQLKSQNFLQTIGSIQPAGLKNIRITFNPITNGNIFLNLNILKENRFMYTTPFTLIFSYSVVKSDNFFSNNEFF